MKGFMLSTIVFFVILCCSFASLAQLANPRFSEYKDKVFNELNGDAQVRALHKKVTALESRYFSAIQGLDSESVRMAASSKNPKKSMYHAEYQSYQESRTLSLELDSARKSLDAEISRTGGHQIFTDPYQFSDSIAADMKSSTGPKVVGFLAGYSAAGHDASVIDRVNTMQKAAAQYFGLTANSSYGLINGASLDGGINEQFERAVKAGTFGPAVDSKNFKTYGAISANIGEWGGMMTTNKSVLLADSPPGNYEMKANPRLSSQNPLSLAMAAETARAAVHIMLNEGSEIGLKEVLEYLNNHHKPGTKALIHLGIGYDVKNPSKDKGIRGASFLAKHLALHPELIESFEKSGIKFMAVDAASGQHYSSIKDYLKSSHWTTQLWKFKNAATEINSDEFAKKKQKLVKLEEKLKVETDNDKKKQLNIQLGTLRGEVALVENRVNSEQKIEGYVGELSKISGYKSGSGPLELVARSSSASVEALKKSGLAVDPKSAAKAAAKGAR